MGDVEVRTDPTQANSTYTQTSSRTDFYSVSGYLAANKTFAQKHKLNLTLGAQYEFNGVYLFWSDGERYSEWYGNSKRFG